jgi:hypothetical protein
MAILTWSPTSNDYNTAGNWSHNGVPSLVPTFADDAIFGTSTFTNISINSGPVNDVGEWLFTAKAQYSFTIGPNHTVLNFVGSGIVVADGMVQITIDDQSGIAFVVDAKAEIVVAGEPHGRSPPACPAAGRSPTGKWPGR